MNWIFMMDSSPASLSSIQGALILPIIKSSEQDRLRHPASGTSMVRRCTNDDIRTVEAIINKAAMAYRGVIPTDCWHEPYMSRSELLDEIAKGVEFWGWQEAGVLVGVMGLQKVRDVTLIRHAYVRPS